MMNDYTLDLTNADTLVASAEAFSFEETLEAQLAYELEKLEQEQQQPAAQDYSKGYNDAEAQRFTHFIDQMPNDMWGMEFVDYP